MTAVSQEFTVDAVALWGAGVNLQGQTKVTQQLRRPVMSINLSRSTLNFFPDTLLYYAVLLGSLQLQIPGMCAERKVDVVHEKLVKVLWMKRYISHV